MSMTKGLLETLAGHGVPPVPEELNERVHQRLNRALLAAQLVDLVLGGMPYLAAHFLRGLGHLAKATFTGRFENDRVDRPREAP
jgi:hypothetical protein